MRKKLADAFLGIVFIVIGIIYVVYLATDHSFSIFFDGWWTLFIILPCVYSMISQGINIGNIIGAGIGVLLFLSVQDVIRYSDIWKFLVPAILILIGISIIIKPHSKKYHGEVYTSVDTSDNPTYTAVFGGQDPNYSGQEFKGAKVNAIFGGADLKLRDAIIKENCVIDISAVFGGADIYLPSNVKIIVNTTPIFGGVDTVFVSSTDVNAPVVTINCVCIFGGVDIK